MTRVIKKNITLPDKVNRLLKKGVRMTAPFSVEIGDDVNLSRISGSLIIYGAARICGKNTLISKGVKLGYEAPVTLIDCRLGKDVELRGGYFADSVFLNKAIMGSGAQIRSGCLLEEESGGNHSVGLKQTILFPFVQLGSLINFCDCFMAGGTSRKNHSEVGSSYIHFNYTPRQDKATPSLIGDVPRGVMLNQSPIFLGGQGGIVGPVKIDYGTVIPAGVICRQDCMGETFTPSSTVNGDIYRKIRLNIEYIANLLALRQWYQHVRSNFFAVEKSGEALYSGARDILDTAIAERLKQMSLFAERLADSSAAQISRKNRTDKVRHTKKQFSNNWPKMEAYLSCGNEEKTGLKKRDSFVKIMQSFSGKGNSYLEAIQLLTPDQAQKGTGWLKDITDNITAGCMNNFIVLKKKEK